MANLKWSSALESLPRKARSSRLQAVKQLRKSVTNPLAMLRGSGNKPAAPEAVPLYVAPRYKPTICVCILRSSI